ncbi:ribosome small subunit-dependent GTPase A [Piscinibacter sp.]|uniref:ribosome small subunit-dependent GTPase A n=1 Tax=Piscinibacter sp. TaxID=1903157 RepID=UPI002B9A482F|nr:ribosome small subunit-dependent GTPase A [Albitalea sp.]HUG22464.1 ribosome small subunit-dependent GTPase A [Albitalea sp.]
MIDIDFEQLRRIGLTPAMAQHLAMHTAAQDGSQTLMRLVEVHRETLRLHDGQVEHSARALPRLTRELDERDTALAVGDWVFAGTDVHGDRWVHAQVPPLSHIARRDADGSRHAVVSNVDTALLVMGLDDDFNLRRLERYLTLVQGSGVHPVVVLTKADVAAPTAELLAPMLAQLRERFSRSLDVLAVNGTHPSAAHALAPYLHAGQTVVLMGSSGAGKSTLTNTLAGEALQDTGAVREHDSRGKHTTTSRSLHCLPGGACVIDTPGLRALRPDVDEATLAWLFDDIGRLALQCRFRDCRHLDEPGCAVREGVGGDRLRNYHKLMREARRDTMTVLERQQQASVWRARGKATRAWMKMKRGA